MLDVSFLFVRTFPENHHIPSNFTVVVWFFFGDVKSIYCKNMLKPWSVKSLCHHFSPFVLSTDLTIDNAIIDKETMIHFSCSGDIFPQGVF
jgi:hypothetical protein